MAGWCAGGCCIADCAEAGDEAAATARVDALGVAADGWVGSC